MRDQTDSAVLMLTITSVFLQALFTADCIRRVAVEVGLSWLTQRVSAARRRREVDSLKREVGEKPSSLQAVQLGAPRVLNSQSL